MSDYGLTVRMYNVGFGDCFLITYVVDDLPRRILIDCGTHLSGAGPRPIGEVVRRIAADVDDGNGPSIDVIVASHRHFDHIAGFDSPAWAAVSVKEVWLPWTEDPDDPAARRIRDAQTKLAVGLAGWSAAHGESATPVAMLALNALSNADAMSTLQHGFSGRPRRRYLPTKTSSTLETSVLPELRVHVLGPSRVEAVIRDLEPPHDQSYLRQLGVATTGDDDAPLRPFPTQGEAAAPLEKDESIKDLHDALRVDVFDLAASLEDAVNGTSLVLAFELGSAVLLFTGDAQWGTWKAALDVTEWQELLRRATFLKIGHHGSHNATPKRLVEEYLPDGFAAMVSVTPVSRWPFIPKKELVERLKLKGARIARSDKRRDTPAGFKREGDWWTEIKIAT